LIYGAPRYTGSASMKFPFLVVHRLGLRRRYFTFPFLRSVARLLCRWRVIPLDYLIGAPLETVFWLNVAGWRFRYCLHPDDIFGSRLYWSGGSAFEPDSIPIFLNHALTAQRILDVGAHTGIYSLLAATANATCEVMAFEPYGPTFRWLEANVEANRLAGRCRLFHAAVGSQCETALLRVPEDKGMVAVDASGAVPVHCLTLDTEVPLDGRTGLVKIDVEGHELAVLQGMEQVIADSRPAILFECNPGSPAAATAIDVFFRSHGYCIYGLANALLQPLDHLIPEDFSHGHHNFLALFHG
jgi:FkbM family methyltransferase